MQQSLPVGYLKRTGVAACAAIGVVAAVGTLNWAAGSPSAICHAIAADRDFEHLFTHAAALVAWLSLGWFCLAVSLEILGQLPGVFGATCTAAASRVSPRIVRRLAQAALGLTILAGPMSTPSAWAATVVTVAGSTTADVSADRPLGSGAAPDVAPSGPTPALPLDRPAFVASPPAAPSMVTPTAPAAIVAGVPHREAPREGYVVRRGDPLWDIAARHLGAGASAADIAREWPRWYAANRSVIGANPSLLRPGELLSPPTLHPLSNARTP